MTRLLILILLAAAAWAEPPPRVMLEVPRVRQELNYCGIASAAMVIEYYRGPIDQIVLGHLASGQSIRVRGVAMDELSSALALFGIRSQMVNVALQREELPAGQHRWVATTPEQRAAGLREELAANHPVIFLRPEPAGDFHAIVVIGCDDVRRQLFYNDPNQPERVLGVDYDTFAKEWTFEREGSIVGLALLTRFDLTVADRDPSAPPPARVDVSSPAWATLIDLVGQENRRYLVGRFWDNPPAPAGYRLVARDFARADVKDSSVDARVHARRVIVGVFGNLLASGRPFLACGGNGRRGGYRLVIGCDPQARLIWYYQGRQRWPAADSSDDFASWWAFRPDRQHTLQVFLLEPAADPSPQ